MLCDMCGSSGKLFRAKVEGAELTVCQKCSKFGNILGVVKDLEEKEVIRLRKEPESENIEIIVQDYAEKIRKKRESLGLTQKDFAKKINEKESLIQKIESGNFKLSIALAKKIEKFLKLRLIEEYEEKHETQKHTKSEGLTIGDFIKGKD